MDRKNVWRKRRAACWVFPAIALCLAGCRPGSQAQGSGSNGGPSQSAGRAPLDPKIVEQMNDYGKKIVSLGGRPELHLDFSNSRLTDDDLINLEIVPMVTSIDLSYTRVTDRGIEHLKKYPQLEVLTLISVPITDASLPYLKEMPNLWKVDFDRTQMSRDGMLEMVRFLNPRRNAHIYGTPDHPRPRPQRN